MHNFNEKKQKILSVILYLALDISHLLLSRYRVSDVQGMGKILETAVKDTRLFTDTELDHHFPVVHLLGIDSRKLRIVFSGILYHFHENISPLRDDDGGILLLTLL